MFSVSRALSIVNLQLFFFFLTEKGSSLHSERKKNVSIEQMCQNNKSAKKQ